MERKFKVEGIQQQNCNIWPYISWPIPLAPNYRHALTEKEFIAANNIIRVSVIGMNDTKNAFEEIHANWIGKIYVVINNFFCIHFFRYRSISLWNHLKILREIENTCDFSIKKVQIFIAQSVYKSWYLMLLNKPIVYELVLTTQNVKLVVVYSSVQPI